MPVCPFVNYRRTSWVPPSAAVAGNPVLHPVAWEPGVRGLSEPGSYLGENRVMVPTSPICRER